MALEQRSAAGRSHVLSLLLAGGILRIALIGWGGWQDTHMAVKYTDIDYQVVTDGARLVADGRSPFERSTFRYTPLLAWLLLPNILVHEAFGKVLFCSADLYAAWLMDAILRIQGVSAGRRGLSLAVWLFSPFTVAISSRGSGEAVVTVLLLLVIHLLFKGRTLWAAAAYGLVVHWRIYPIIYALPIWLFLPGADESSTLRRQRKAQLSTLNQEKNTRGKDEEHTVLASGAAGERGNSRRRNWSTLRPVIVFFSRGRMAFGIVAAGTFACLGLGCYALYGDLFLHEAYFYHGGRRDPRHNFAPYFYPTYLELGTPLISNTLARLASVCQLGTVGILGARFAAHLPFAMLLQTLAFVALNKVCTAQYFVWYFSLASLVMPFINPLRQAEGEVAVQRGMLIALGGWAAAQIHWLGWAYLLEFEGRSVYLGVWAAGIVFLVANVAVIVQLLHSFVAEYSFREQSRAHVSASCLTFELERQKSA